MYTSKCKHVTLVWFKEKQYVIVTRFEGIQTDQTDMYVLLERCGELILVAAPGFADLEIFVWGRGLLRHVCVVTYWH